MKWFPQLGTGALAQLPLRRLRTWRAIRNVLENGERITLPDAGSGLIEWRLAFRDLSTEEKKRLEDFFISSKGQYGAFGFIDPLANLVGWSEDLAHSDWQPGLITIMGGATDPLGTSRAWIVTNGGQGNQQLTQTVAVPGDYTGCFSAWIRSETKSFVKLRRDATATTAMIGPVWKRFFVSCIGNSGEDHSEVSVELTAGQSIQLWGLQFEVQPYASQYKPSGRASGTYEETYFGADELNITSTGVGLSACEFTLLTRI